MRAVSSVGVLIGLAAGTIVFCQSTNAAQRTGPPRLEYHAQAEFDQILRENSLFFNMLVSFSFTAGVAEPAWGCDVDNININLITRSVRDPQGRQIVRVRVAGVVRSNNNVELNVLDENGNLVGQGFYGYDSGQLTFYDWNGRTIIRGTSTLRATSSSMISAFLRGSRTSHKASSIRVSTAAP